MNQHKPSTDQPVVLHVVDSYLPITETWIYSQLTGMQRHRPVVVARKLANTDAFPLDGIFKRSWLFCEPRQIWQKAVNRGVETLTGYQSRRRASVARCVGAKLIHAHFGAVGYESLKLKSRTGLPLITAFYGHDACCLPNLFPKWKARYLRLFESGDLFLAEGGYMKKTLMSLGCPEEKVIVQHLGVDVEKIAFMPRKPEGDGTISILTVGSFREKKGLIYAAEAFVKLAKDRPNVQLVVVGDGVSPEEIATRTKVQKVLDDTGLLGRVRFTGYIEYSELIKEMAKAHICLQPSVVASDGDAEGGAPVCLIDMSASGMPVVATRHCDIPEVIPDGQAGFLVPERDVDALADRLLHLVDHPETWEDMARAGRRHVEANYNVKTQCARLEEIYDSIRFGGPIPDIKSDTGCAR